MFVFIQYFIKYEIKFKIIVNDKTVYYAEIFFKKKKIKLYCSYKLTLLSLSNLAEFCSIEKKKIFPYGILNNNLKKQQEVSSEMFNTVEDYNNFIKIYGKIINVYKVIEDYCKNDALITKKSIIYFYKILEQNNYNIKKKPLTAAKLSIDNFFKKKTLVKKKINIKYDRILRPYYYGGRVEVFGNQYEDEILLHYDWSGMYAQCMEEKVLGGEIFIKNKPNDFNTPGFYWVEFKQSMNIPVLPIKINEKLIFQNGTFKGWYWFEELILAKNLGVEILKIEKMIGAQQYDYFLKDFVNNNNNLRKKGKIEKIIGKNNNNTFYGRLGMNPESSNEEIITNFDIHNYKKIIKINNIYIGNNFEEKSISNITIAASITAKARIKLYKGMLEIHKNNGRVLYVDTDSIIAAFKKNEYKSKLDKNLGEVYFDSKDDLTIIEEAVFAIPKTYAIKYLNGKEIVKIKGFNVKPSFKEFKEKFYKKEIITTENIEWNKKDFYIKLIKKEKNTNLHSLNKRVWDKNLKNTTPLENDPYINENDWK